MEPKFEKEKLNINKRKIRSLSYKNKFLNKSPMENKKMKLNEEKNISSAKNNSKADLLHVIKNKQEMESVLKDYVVEEDPMDFQQASKKKKISQKQIKRIEKSKERKENSLPAKDPLAEERTIFVGNVNINATRGKVKLFFAKYGEVETVRFRGITPESMNMSKKQAVATKQFNPHRKSLNAYVRFTSTDSVEKSLEANGSIFEDLHIHVDRSLATNIKDKNSIFVGNLPWEINEEDLWEHFGSCGKITNVRVVRSSLTGAGKGFAFVSFQSRDGVEMALHFDGKNFMNRQLRIKKTVKKVKDNKLSEKVSKKERKKKKSAMNVSFLKYDKPQLREKAIKEKKRRHKPRKNAFVSQPENFTGIKVVKGARAVKNVKKKRNETERKKFILAKKLTVS